MIAMKSRKNMTGRILFRVNILIIALLFAGCSGMLDVPGDDKPGVNITAPGGGYSVAEAGGTLELNVTLNTKPKADVTFTLNSSNVSEATVSDLSLTFTPSNWDDPQTITIFGVDEFFTDGNKNISLQFGAAVSTDPAYSGYIRPSVTITVIDNETDSIVVSPTSGLITTEAGSTATFTVVLSSEPETADVTIAVSSNDPSEGTVDTGLLTFTSSNWDDPQMVTITGEDDDILDGNVNYTIVFGNSVCADPHYSNMAILPVSVTNNDDDVPAIVVTPTVLNLTENGANGTFTVRLSKEPLGDVTIPVTCVIPSGRATVDTSMLTFTTGNYDDPQTVTVDPQNNSIEDGNISFTVVLETATNYNNEDPDDVTVNINDDDSVSIVASSLSRNTDEDGQDATFTVRLDSQPTADVTITVNEKCTYLGNSNNNLGQEGTIDKTTLTFTTGDWDQNQTVRVTGVNDDIVDGPKQYFIELRVTSSADTDYLALAPIYVTVNNYDNDFIGLQVVANGVTTNTTNSSVVFSGFATDDMNRLGSTYSTFTIRPGSQPTANVTLNLTINATGTTYNDGTLSETSLIFTPVNWKIPRIVHVTGASNVANEGGHEYAVNVSISTTDTDYSNPAKVMPPSFSIFSSDNDAANLIAYCRKSGSFSTTEGGGTATFWLITQDPPGSTETVTLSSSDLTEGTGPVSVTINSSNWNTLSAAGSNKVTVTGIDDPDVDGNVLYTVLLDESSGVLNFDAPDVSLRNIDNEQVIIVGNAVGNTTENGGTATFGVKLGIQPTDDVTFAIQIKAGSTEGAGLSESILTFTDSNWDSYQTITITGLDDHAVDGDSLNYVSFGPVSTADGRIDGYQHPDVAPVLNIDNDKLIWITNSTYYGNLNSGIVTADTYCNNAADSNKPTDMGSATYKALLVDGVTRRATSVGPTDATGQLNWVLQPNTEYYLKTGSKPYTQKVFTTNAYGMFVFGNLTTMLSTNASHSFWTGLNNDWTTSSDTCGEWKLDGTTGRYGVGNTITSNSISAGSASNLTLRKFISVQQ